eukprot:PhF_6_TR29452/c0_g1_i1/m.43647/K02183/CALM; calmodulin
MAHRLAPEQLIEFKDAFMMFDPDNDGVITTEELCFIMSTLGKSMTDVQDMLADVDAHNTGIISMNSFLDLMARYVENTDREEDMKDAFRRFDVDSSGFVHMNCLRHCMMSQGDLFSKQDIDELARQVEVDARGFVRYEEFIKMLL